VRRLGPALAVGVACLLAAGCGGHHPGATTVSGGKDGATAARLEVESGATSITVRATDLGDDLYRVSTPDGAGVKPSVVRDGGRVQVFLSSNGSGPAAVTVLIADDVVWRLRFDGGATDLAVDLRHGRPRAVDLVAGDAHVSLRLPPPHGTVPIQLAAGASELALHVAGRAPVRVAVQSGAASVTLDGVEHHGVAAGTVFAPPGWAAAADRYDVLAHAGVGTLTLDRS
jgi:hypothetical protein